MFIITEAKGAEPMVTDGYLYIAENNFSYFLKNFLMYKFYHWRNGS